MFDKEFYPTPQSIIDMMLNGLSLKGKTVLEPSAGKGDIVSAVKLQGAKVIACERHPDLARIVQHKCNRFLKHDFFDVTATEISHIDYIIANPPFSNADRHILHMWEIAPEGCQIISLCNINTVESNWRAGNASIKKIVEQHGSYEQVIGGFSDAERQTDVVIAIVKLFKPKAESEDEFSGYFDLTEEYEHSDNGIMQYSEIRDIVSRYVSAVKMFTEVQEASQKINNLISPINPYSSLVFGAFENRNSHSHPIDRDTFKKNLQKQAWRTIFSKLKMEKYATSNVMANINRFVEKQENVPFTLINIYKMIEMIIGTHGSRMQSVIVEAFDRITQHHEENRYGVEGWKTNDCFMVNRKFILPWIVEVSFRGTMQFRYMSGSNPIDDLTKALCYLTGTSYETIGDLDRHGNDGTRYQFGEWFTHGFLRMKGYKKGSLHAEFLSAELWEKFNIEAVKGKGWQLPPTTKHKYRAQEYGVETFSDTLF